MVGRKSSAQDIEGVLLGTPCLVYEPKVTVRTRRPGSTHGHTSRPVPRNGNELELSLRSFARSMSQDPRVFLERLTPQHNEETGEIFSRASRLQGFRLLDLDAAFHDSGMPEDVFFRVSNPVHHTPLGADCTARTLADDVMAAGWLAAPAPR